MRRITIQGRFYALLLLICTLMPLSCSSEKEAPSGGGVTRLLLQLPSGNGVLDPADFQCMPLISRMEVFVFDGEEQIIGYDSVFESLGKGDSVQVILPQKFHNKGLTLLAVLNDSLESLARPTTLSQLRKQVTQRSLKELKEQRIPLVSAPVVFTATGEVSRRLQVDTPVSFIYVEMDKQADGSLNDYIFSMKGAGQVKAALFPGHTVENPPQEKNELYPLTESGGSELLSCYYPTNGEITIEIKSSENPTVTYQKVFISKEEALLRSHKYKLRLTKRPDSSLGVDLELIPWDESDLDINFTDADNTQLESLNVKTDQGKLAMNRTAPGAYSLVTPLKRLTNIALDLPEGATISPDPNQVMGDQYAQLEFVVIARSGKRGESFNIEYHPNADKAELLSLNVNSREQSLVMTPVAGGIYSLVTAQKKLTNVLFDIPVGATVSPNPDIALPDKYGEVEFVITARTGKKGAPFKVQYHPDANKTTLDGLLVTSSSGNTVLRKNNTGGYVLQCEGRRLANMQFELPKGASISPDPNAVLSDKRIEAEFVITSSMGNQGAPFKVQYYPDRMYTLVVLGDTEFQMRHNTVPRSKQMAQYIVDIKKSGSHFFIRNNTVAIDPELLMVVGDVSEDRNNDERDFWEVFQNCFTSGISCLNIYGNHDWDPIKWTDGSWGYFEDTFGTGEKNWQSRTRIDQSFSNSNKYANPKETLKRIVLGQHWAYNNHPYPYYFTYRGVRYFCGNTMFFQPRYHTWSIFTKPGNEQEVMQQADDVISEIEQVIASDNKKTPTVWFQHFPLNNDWMGGFIPNRTRYNSREAREAKLKALIRKTRNPAMFSGHTHDQKVHNYNDFRDYTTARWGDDGDGYMVLMSEKEGVLEVVAFSGKNKTFRSVD